MSLDNRRYVIVETVNNDWFNDDEVLTDSEITVRTTTLLKSELEGRTEPICVEFYNDIPGTEKEYCVVKYLPPYAALDALTPRTAEDVKILLESEEMISFE